MDYVDFLFPHRNKLFIFLVLVIVFLIRWNYNVDTLDYQCVDGNCAFNGELERRVGFPFDTDRVYVNGTNHFNYFYDFNLAVDLGFWYLIACLLDFLRSTVKAQRVRKEIIEKVNFPDE